MVVSKSIPINRRAAQENAAMQEQKRASNLTGASKADSRAVVQTLNQLQMTPKGERDAAWTENYNKVLSGKDAATSQGQYFNDIATNPIQDNYKAPTNNLDLGFNPSNGTIQNNQYTPTDNLMGLDGRFNASAIKRLRASGMSDSDIKKQLNGLKPSIKETMSDTSSIPSAFLQKNNVELPFGGSITTEQTGANGNREYILSNGVRVSANAYDAESGKAIVKARENARLKETVNAPVLNVVSYTDNPDGTTTNFLSDGTSERITYTKNPDGSLTPVPVAESGMPAIPSNVPEEYKPFVDYYLSQTGSERKTVAQNAAVAAVSGADAIAKAEQEAALVRQENNEADLAAQKQLIEEQKLAQEKFLAEQKQVADDQIALEEARALYNDQAAKKQSLFEMTNALALSGGFSSGNGLEHIQSTKAKLNEHTEYITKSYGIEKRKLINDFKASYLQIEQQADNNVQLALKDYKSEAAAINSFSLQSTSNAINAKTKAVQDYSDKVDSILKDRDTAVGKAIDLSVKAIESEKDYQWKQTQLLLQLQDKADAREIAALARGDSQEIARTNKSAQTMLAEMNRITTRINNDPILKPYSALEIKFETIHAGYEKTMEAMKSGNYASLNTLDQDLITSINKMWDENSVVREAEYDRTPSGMSVPEYFKAKVSSLVYGGILSENERKWVKGYIDTMNDTWEVAANDALDKFYLQINKTNSQLLPEDYLSPLDFGLPETNIAGKGNTNGSYDNSSILDLMKNKPVVKGTGGGETLSYLSLGRETQNFSTPVASKENGGLYDQSTVDAWEGKHAGLDVAMPVGTKLPSLTGGKVIQVANTTGWGKTIEFEDEFGGTHRLSHLSDVRVKKGDTILKGQIIAASGNTGHSTGPHLDYRIKVNGKYVDPSSYFHT